MRVTASEGLEEELTADILIPVVPNKNLEIFLLYRKIVNPDTFVNYMKYCNPTDGSFEGEWIPDPVNYGKFCVDSNNNLYILDIDGNCIQKKSSRGDPILKSDEIPENSYTIDNNSYTINIGPNGYVYFTLNTDTSMEGPKYCIKKINPNTLIIEDVLYLTIKNTYYGFAIDSDGESTYVYIHNYTNQKIEKWSFKTGSIVDVHNLTNNYILSALAIAGDYIGGVKEDEIVKNAFIIHKNLSTSESEFTLSNITEPFYISSIGGDFLFSGLGDSDRVVFGRYGVDNSEKWHKGITEYLPYSDCIIGSYPF